MTRPTRPASRAVVLSGGGSAGGAWMAGLITALRDDGVDLGDADLIVGTSAGALLGAQLATGAIDLAVQVHRNRELPRMDVPVRLEKFVAAARRIIAEVADPREAARRIANLEPLGHRLVPAAERRRWLAARLPVLAWPDTRLVITAVDAESGRRVTFDSGSSVELLDAVTASSALPGIFPLAEINGRRYADGGVHSPYNSDLASGHDIVTVLSPMPLDEQRRGRLDSELATLDSATVHTIIADEASLTAIGPNPISARTAQVAADAGAAQAKQEINTLAPVWTLR